MNKEWIKAKEAKYAAIAQAQRAEIIAKIDSVSFLTDEDKEALEKVLDRECGKSSYNAFKASAIFEILKNHDDKDAGCAIDYMEVKGFIHNLNTDQYNSILYKANGGLKRYLDSEPMEFDGDIIITDPCYITRDGDKDTCGYGYNMEALGIQNYMTRDTIYGDWSCTVYNTDTEKAIGEFCADAGLVSVFLLDEVLKYNPGFDYHKERDWTTALISDFKGTVQFVVEHEEGVYEDTTEYYKVGEKWEDYSVYVVGHGVNKKTGEPINFRSTQTGL